MSEEKRKRDQKNSNQDGSQPRQRRNEFESKRCLELLDQLQPSDLIRLREYAAWRVRRVGLEAMFGGEDIVQDALGAVLRGLDSAKHGRHPSPADLATHAGFANYLRGAINSVVEAKSRHFRREAVKSFEYATDLSTMLPFDTNTTPAEEAQFRNLSEEFFRRLRKKAPRRLLSMLNAWEKLSAWADNIPLGRGCRRDRAELRRLAAQVMRELHIENG